MRTNSQTIFFFYWLPVIIYGWIIFLISSIPGQDIPVLFFGQDIIFHIVEYAGFGYLVCRLTKQVYPLARPGQVLILAFLVSLVYGLTDEYHQSFVLGKSATVLDVAMDCLGGLLAGVFYR